MPDKRCEPVDVMLTVKRAPVSASSPSAPRRRFHRGQLHRPPELAVGGRQRARGMSLGNVTSAARGQGRCLLRKNIHELRMGCELEVPTPTACVRARKWLKRLMSCRRGTRGRTWLGGRDSIGSFQETARTTGCLRVNLVGPAIWRFRLLSSAFVEWRSFSSCASAMALAMTLDAKDFLTFP
jgi:hypothetical protein